MVLQSTTQAVTSYRIFPGHLNEHQTLFGGQTLRWLDDAASIAAQRFAHRELVTGSLDTMRYVAPLRLRDAVSYESVVTGAGKRSLEVFTKIVGEHLDTGERFLAGYAWMTFVAVTEAALPPLELDFEEGKRLAAGYAERKATNQRQAAAMPDLAL